MESDFAEMFGKRLEAELKKHGGKRQLAEKLGCSYVTLNFWTHGKVPFAIHLLGRMRDLCDIDINELIEGEQSNDTKSTRG